MRFPDIRNGATVTDSRVPHWVGSDSVSHYKPALAAAYDYYPFGMLMPGRHVQDTSGKCMTVSTNKWMSRSVSDCYDQSDWPWPGFKVTGSAFTGPYGTDIIMTGNGDYIEFEFDIIPGKDYRLSLDVSQYYQGPIMVSILEYDGGWRTIMNDLIWTSGVHDLFFDSQMELIAVRLSGYFDVDMRQLCLGYEDYGLYSVLVDVCNDKEDNYMFGYNGQEKINEWAGIGNSLDFGSRIHDSRLGRFLSLDPLMKKFPSESNYSFAGNSPIMLLDKRGEKKTVYTKIIDETTGKTYVRTDVSSGLLKRVSTRVGTAWYDDRSDFYRQNDWYDYTVTNTLVIHKDGTANYSSTSEVPTKLRTSTFPFMGEKYAKLKTGESFPKVKDKGMFDGFYLYSKDADGSDSKFNPTGGPGSKAVDAGPIMQAMRRINTIVGSPPSDIISAIKYLNHY